jgi:DNA-directed RNA polymerase specialized sigma24 family protein
MSSSFDPTELIHALQDGKPAEKEAAYSKIFNRYFGRLLTLAQGRLHPRIRQRVGADEIVNSGLKSVFFHFQEGQVDWHSEESLWNMLAGVIINKASEAARRHTAQKRNVFHEQNLAPVNPGSSADPVWDHMACEPTPEEVMFLQEIIEKLPDEDLQQVVLGKLQGKTDEELAQELGYSSTETIRIKKRRIEGLWRRYF